MASVKLTDELKGSLEQVLNGLNFLPAVKEEMIKELSVSISPEKVNFIMDGQNRFDAIARLTDKETYHFFKKIHAFSRDDRFDPNKLVEVEDEKEGFYSKQDFYNNEFKEKFMKKYKPATVKSLRVLFGRTAKFEREYKKDLYDFTYEQLEELWKSINALTLRSLQNVISSVEQYIDFAIDKRVTVNKVNLAVAFDSKEKIKKYLKDDAQTIFMKDNIMDICLDATNAQDGVILALIFDGVSYKNEYEELINLREKDFDFTNNLIKLPNRTIKMSQETKILVKGALKDTEYYSLSGEKMRTYKIAESDYVLRGLRNNYQIKWRNINQRILRLSKDHELEYLNGMNVSYSGQIHYALELMNEGLSMDEAVEHIITRFDINDNNSSRFYVKTRIENYLKIHGQQ